MSVEQNAVGEGQDRSAVRSLRRATGLPAPFRPASPAAVVLTPAPEDAPAPGEEAARDAVPPVAAQVAGDPAVVTSAVEEQPVATHAATPGSPTVQLDALLALASDPREVTRRYREAHELGGSKSDTFTVPVELFQTLNRVCKERRVTKKWLVATALDGLLQAWGEDVRPD